MAKLSLSARAYHRILKVARTIADLEEATPVCAPHIAEAIGYRRFDRM
jgi:magnesium chelatase family protein